MPYAVKQDLIDRAGDLEITQISDRDGIPATATAAINAALAQADERINAVLALRFSLPLSETPPVVKSWAVSIARYFLHRDGPPEHVRNDYKEALADLDRVASGKMAVPGAAGLEPLAGGESGSISFSGDEPSFTRDKLEGFL